MGCLGKSNGELGRIGKGEVGCWAGPGEERWRSGGRVGGERGGMLGGAREELNGALGGAGEEPIGCWTGQGGAGRSDGELGRIEEVEPWGAEWGWGGDGVLGAQMSRESLAYLRQEVAEALQSSASGDRLQGAQRGSRTGTTTDCAPGSPREVLGNSQNLLL